MISSSHAPHVGSGSTHRMWPVRHHAAASPHCITGPLPHRRSMCTASPWPSLPDRGPDLAPSSTHRRSEQLACSVRLPPSAHRSPPMLPHLVRRHHATCVAVRRRRRCCRPSSLRKKVDPATVVLHSIGASPSVGSSGSGVGEDEFWVF
ncbi:hypothetical protein ACLOJK_026581 [Asimina triloba]